MHAVLCGASDNLRMILTACAVIALIAAASAGRRANAGGLAAACGDLRMENGLFRTD